MSSEPTIQLKSISKHYFRYASPFEQLKHQLFGNRIKTRFNVFEALHDCSLELNKGESLGIVGLNGAGKSTLLQIIAGTLTPTHGKVKVLGKVSALLELGSGFNPEFSGRENIYLNAATLGLTKSETDEIFEDIVEFSGLRGFIDQPVKTYSSGMQVRLGFAVATSVQPDVLIIDEALSVGDGTFAKKSFDRIMQIRAQGASLLFCSHALFHVDIFCDKTLWLDQGKVRGYGTTREILPMYQSYLDQLNGGDTTTHEPLNGDHRADEPIETEGLPPINSTPDSSHPTTVRLIKTRVILDGTDAPPITGVSLHSELCVEFTVKTTPDEPNPRMAVVISDQNGKILATCFSPESQTYWKDDRGIMHARVSMNPLLINKGSYRVGAYVLCHRGQFVYEWVDPVTTIHLTNEGPHQGGLILPGEWE